MKSLLLALLLIGAGGSSLNAANLYVSTAGSDTYDGTSATFVSGTTGPKKTVNAAMSIASAGDVINIANGVYSETVTVSKSLQFAVSSSGSSNVQLRSLHMNGSGVTLTVTGDTLDIKDTLELALGFVNSTGSKAFRTMAGAIRLGGSKNSFVKGPIWIGLTSGATSLDFHIGVNQDYRYTQLNFNKTVTGLVYYHMEAKSGAPATGGALPSGIRNLSKVHHWELGFLPTGTSNNFELTVSYDSITADDEVFESNFLRVLGHAPAGSWVDLGGMGSADRKGQIATNTFQTQMTFVLANVKNGVNVLGSTNAFAKFVLAKGRCERDTFFFTDLSRSTSTAITYWKWNFGDGNTLTYTNTGKPSKIFRKYATYGNYTVTLIVGNSTDEDTFSYNLRVGVLPTVMFNKNIYTNGVCVGDTSLFIDTYTPPSPESIFSRKWDLGDLTTATSVQVNHVYAAGGNFKIYLTRTTALGCKAIDSLDYLVHSLPAPAIDFPPGGDPICFGKTSFYSNSTQDPAPDKLKSWVWDRGDGSALLTGNTTNNLNKNVAYKYLAPGVYIIKLKVTSDFGCIDSTEYYHTVNPIPDAKFTLSHTCLDEVTQTNDQTNLKGTVADIYVWNFGDFTVNDSTYPNTTHQYAAVGTYKATLKVITTDGCTDTASYWIKVHPKPTPSFTTKQVCLGDTTVMRRVKSTTIPDNQIIYNWIIDQTPPQYIDTMVKKGFNTPGAHDVTLIGTTTEGCQDSSVQQIRVYYLPKVSFFLDPLVSPNDSTQCLNENNFYFVKEEVFDADDTMKLTSWDFGDGVTELPANSTNHKFAAAGTYTLRLYAQNIHGCADSMFKTYTVAPSPVAAFYSEGICVPDSIYFYDTASTSVDPIIYKLWDFGNGTLSSLDSPVVWVDNVGPLDVSYILTTDAGCSDTARQSLTFIQKPNLSFSYNGSLPLCKGDSLEVTVIGGDSISWLKDSSVARVRSFYNKGWYKVRAFSTGAVCYTEDSVQILAFPPANVKAFSDTTIYRGKYATLWSAGATNFTWTPGKTLDDSTKASVIARPLSTTMYYLVSLDSNGCADIDSVLVTVVDPPILRIPNLITPNNDGQNDAWDLIELADLFLYDIDIHDRQGKLIYESSDYQNDWMATDMNGETLPDGIYFYYMKNRFTGEQFRGYIQVIR